jgi:predicted secreted protein
LAKIATTGKGRIWRGVVVAVALGAIAGVAQAKDEPDPMHRVSFLVESSRDVNNDWVQAVIGVTDEDTDSARLANRINTLMTKALTAAKASPTVQVKSGGYSTHPIHEDGKLRRWRASQDLILESADVKAVTALVAQLQADLQLRSIGFSISPERRRAVEDELIAEALSAFKARAEIVRQNLDARDYELVQVFINTQGGPQPAPMYMEMQARTMSAAKVAPPALEGGTSTISVQVNGTVELE